MCFEHAEAEVFVSLTIGSRQSQGLKDSVDTTRIRTPTIGLMGRALD